MDYSMIKLGDISVKDFMDLMIFLVLITVFATMAANDLFTGLFRKAIKIYHNRRSR